MGRNVFGGWQTWEKLVFALACAIIVTILLGCIKLSYTRWRLRKLAALESGGQELAECRPIDRTRSRINQKPDDVPFGIRALENGIQVEGVWISQGNTPEPCGMDGSTASSIWKHVPGKQYNIDLERQFGTWNHTTSASKAVKPMSQPANSSCQPLGFNNGVLDSQAAVGMDAVVTKPMRGRHPPVSYTRYQMDPYILRRHSLATNTLFALEAIHRASSSIHDNSEWSPESTLSSNPSRDSGEDLAPISASAPKLLSERELRYRSKPGKSSQMSFSSDLELLDNHRASQAAETGQLTPRGRTVSNINSATSPTSPAPGGVSGEQPDYFNLLNHAMPGHYLYLADDEFSQPTHASLPPSVRTSGMPDIMPFEKFVKMAPPSPRLDSRQTNDVDSILALSPTESSSAIDDSPPSSPIMPASEGAASLKLPPPSVRPSFEKQSHQVVRGHGSGFEILEAGTLFTPRHDSLQKHKTIPSLSFNNASRGSYRNMESQRKLQKKRQPSFDSFRDSNTRIPAS